MAEQGRLTGGGGNHRGTYQHTATRSIYEVLNQPRVLCFFRGWLSHPNSHGVASCVVFCSTEVSPSIALPGEMLRMMYAMAIMR